MIYLAYTLYNIKYSDINIIYIYILIPSFNRVIIRIVYRQCLLITHSLFTQYDNYVVPEVNKHVNGTLTLNENLADNGGILESFRVSWPAMKGAKQVVREIWSLSMYSS